MIEESPDHHQVKQWKESAMVVLAEWDKVWRALEKPGTLGESKAEACLEEIKRIKTKLQNERR